MFPQMAINKSSQIRTVFWGVEDENIIVPAEIVTYNDNNSALIDFMTHDLHQFAAVSESESMYSSLLRRIVQKSRLKM